MLWIWFCYRAPGLDSAVPHPHGNTRTRPEQFPSLPLAKPRQQQGTDKAIRWKCAFVVPIFNSVPYSNLIHFCQTPKGLFLIKFDHGFLTQLIMAQSYQDTSTRPDFFEGISAMFQTPPSCYSKQDGTGTSSVTINIWGSRNTSERLPVTCSHESSQRT